MEERERVSIRGVYIVLSFGISCSFFQLLKPSISLLAVLQLGFAGSLPHCGPFSTKVTRRSILVVFWVIVVNSGTILTLCEDRFV